MFLHITRDNTTDTDASIDQIETQFDETSRVD